MLQRQRTKPVGEENGDECRARQRDEPPRTPSTGRFGDLQAALDEEMRMDRIPTMRPYVEVLDFRRRDKRVVELEV